MFFIKLFENGDKMKKLFGIICLIFLYSCSSENERLEFEIVNEEPNIYCVSYETKEIECVHTDYRIENYNDVFKINTSYMNYLPIGYMTYGVAEVGLVNSYVKDSNVFYEVDEYYSLIDNKIGFLELLNSNNKLLGYNNTYIIYKNEIISLN